MILVKMLSFHKKKKQYSIVRHEKFQSEQNS